MIYRIYTDAATKLHEGYSSVAFLILRGNVSIKTYCSIHDRVSSTSIAESIAVSSALRYLVNEVGTTNKDEVIVFCDSLYTVKLARKCLKAFKQKDDKLFVKPVNAHWLTGIYESIPKIEGKLTFNKIKAHAKGKNPHCYVDRLAKSALYIV